MRYALFVCADESAAVSDKERQRREAAFTRFRDQMRVRGVLEAVEWLHGVETATTVRCWDGGDVMIADGPFAETKEQIVGVLLADCKDLDEAIEVATRVPAARQRRNSCSGRAAMAAAHISEPPRSADPACGVSALRLPAVT